MKDRDSLRSEVARACRVLGRLDLTKGTLGHVSARIPDEDRVLIRARGPAELGVELTTEDQVIEIDLDGEVISSRLEGLAPPLEVFIHTALYRRRPDVLAVTHLHPRAAMLSTVCETPLLPIYGAYDPQSAQLAIDGVPVYPRSTLIDTPRLGDDLADVIGDKRVCLMHGHGVTTVGPSVADAALHAIFLNDLASLNHEALKLGGQRPISVEDQVVIASLGKPKPGEGHPTSYAAALWRYYCARTGA
jgi:ribulose-5-phosphate 4-epimerase/fuculose-1-phosphate aldolase